MPSNTHANPLVESLDPRHTPLDLKITYLWIGLTLLAIYLPYPNASPLRVVFALPFILFIPGYLLIAALFPARSDLDGIERIALSFGLSIAVVPLIGLALNYTPWGIRDDPIIVSFLLFFAGLGIIAGYRRQLIPEGDRYVLPVQEVVAGARSELFEDQTSGTDRLLSVILLVAIVAAIATTAYVIAVPKEGERFTEFYILGPRGMAADYPTDFAAGTQQTVIIGIGNHEYRNVTYTVETFALTQEFDAAANRSIVQSASLLDRFTVTVPHNETLELPYTFTIDDPSVNRVQFLLHTEPPPDSVAGLDRIEASYRDLHLWVRVR
ncbi:MAG: DUF1616 domain-containing protein [Methanomicrobiaceae archaeon]|nr:DUF1616 domain-containing protein [Methanomicrobiaceae archaeon]MDD5420221.1 DUF1616 domain-containing protein [Methanomicrobiaceae archaeon]